ncbi:hypothetical protein FOZ62_021307, partial [Perkinsus olseni]
RVILDSEIKDSLSGSAPFKQFLEQAVFIDAQSTKKVTVDDDLFGTPREKTKKGIPITLEILDVPETAVTEQLVMHGYFAEVLDMILSPMARVGQEPLGSMGHDAPLACLSRLPLSSFYYMQQLFAEATNPAIDPLREAIVMSLECPIGPQLISCDEGYTVNGVSATGAVAEAPIFAAGDCRRGASLIVTALAEGRDVAAVIDRLVFLAVIHKVAGTISACRSEVHHRCSGVLVVALS